MSRPLAEPGEYAIAITNGNLSMLNKRTYANFENAVNVATVIAKEWQEGWERAQNAGRRTGPRPVVRVLQVVKEFL